MDKNSQVDLVVSAGPTVTKVTVPSVVGQQLTVAIQLITSKGLAYQVEDVTGTKPPGTVLKQDPAGGTDDPVDQDR